MRKYLLVIPVLILIISCQGDLSIIYPEFGNNSWLLNSTKLDDSAIVKLQGIYFSSNPQKRIGDSIVVKSNKNKLMIFCRQAVDFVLLDGGVLDSGIVFEGYGRDLETVDVNLVRVFIRNDEGAFELLNGGTPKSLILNISIESDTKSGKGQAAVKYEFVRKLNTEVKFKIIAHRGGARNSDLFHASENSLEMIRFAENLGANGIEIDIRLTKDKVPVLFHDDYISKRLVEGDLLIGSIEKYTLPHLKTFCILKNGESIPTLEEALNTVINHTNLDFVWLDIKSPAVVDVIIPIILKFNEIKKTLGRDVEFYIGISSEQVQKQLMDNPDFDKILSLSELSPEELEVSKSKYWAPQWTLGYQNQITGELISKGVNSIVWTLDERSFIKEFIDKGQFDGILTNFAPIVFYEFYIRN